MSKAYRLIKSRHSGLWQAVPETAKAHGMGKSIVKAGALAAVFACASPRAWAVDTYWSGGTGDWFVSGNWGTNAVPAIGDYTYIENGGTAQVQAAGAVASELRVGLSGTGNLEIGNGGTLSTSSFNIIGRNAGSSGTATVDGAGSSLTGKGLNVGAAGTGMLTIRNGGSVSSIGGGYGYIFIGSSRSGTGTATVTGASSSLTSRADLNVGDNGTATLNIEDGGIVNVGGGFLLGLANGSGSSGTINIGNGAAAGILNATEVRGGNGTATLNFNHTDSGYYFTGDGTSGGTAVNITGSTAVKHTGSGTTILTGANTYSGGTTVEAGTLRRSVAEAFASNTAYTVNGGTLHLNNLGLTMSSFSGTGGAVNIGTATLEVNQSADTSYAGAITGTTGTLLKRGTGTLTLTGTSATDYTRVNGGTLGIAGGGALTNTNGYVGYDQADSGTATVDGPGSNWTNSAGLFVGWNGSGTLNITNGGTVSNTNGNIGYGVGGSGTVTVDGSGSTWTSSSPLTVGNYGSGTLSISSDGVVNVATGTATLASQSFSTGTLNIGTGGAAGVLNATTVNGGSGTATLNFNHADSAYYFTNDGAASGTAINITGGTAVNHDGSGTTTLNGTNTYTGTTTVNTGTLSLAGGSAIANAGTVVVNSGGTLNLTASETIGSLAGAGGVSLNAATILTTGGNNASTTYSGVMSGSGSLTKAGTGTLTLSGTNTYTGGTTVSAGTLQGNSTSLRGTITNNAAVSFDQVADGTYAGVMSGTGTLAKQGAGTLTLTGANTYSGGTTVSAGTLQGNSTSLQGAITNNAAVSFNQVADGTYAGAMSGTGILAKTGAGILTLTGANTYTGSTTVSGGTLALSGSGTLGDAATGNLTVNGGTLYLGTTSQTKNTTITLTDGAINNGTLTSSGSFAVQKGSIGAILVGTAALTKTGADTVTLTGSNTYTGGTTVSAGTLQGNSDSLQGAITNNAAVIFDQVADGTYAGAMSGTGTLAKTGAGILTLTGANTYTGGTTVSAGTLQGNSSSLQSSITNNAAVIFNQSTVGTYAGAMSGTGVLTKTGAGILTLAGTNTYSGGTTVSAGTLQGNSTSLQGAITNNAAVSFNQGTNGTYAGAISGTGTLAKQGSGTLTLTGTNTYSGTTRVSGGRLAVNGSLTNSAVTVGSGGTLGGSGSISGAVTVNSGGTLAPGNSPGLLTVGSLTLGAGSSTTMEIDGTARGTQYDAIDVTGTATLDGTLNLVFGYTPTVGDSYTLIDAAAINGDFSSVATTGLGAALKAIPTITDDYVMTVDFMQGSFVTAAGGARALTGNQFSVAANLDTFSTSGQATDLIASLNTLSAGALPSAFDQLSGASHAFAPSLAFNAVRQFQRVLGQRGSGIIDGGDAFTAFNGLTGANLAYAGDDLASLVAGEKVTQDGFWVRALAADGRINSDGNAAGADTSGAGLALGADRWIDANRLAGVALAYGTSRADSGGGKLDVESFQLAAYGRWQDAAYYVDGSVGYGRHRTESRRDIAFLNQQARANYDADSLSLALEAGRPIARGPATLTPYAGIEGSMLRLKEFTETGSAANLSVQGRTETSWRSRLGARYAWSDTRFQPRLDLGWVHAFDDTAENTDARFAAAPAASAFRVAGPELDRDRLALGLGLTAWAGKNTRLDLAYNAEFAGSDRDQHVGATFRLVW